MYRQGDVLLIPIKRIPERAMEHESNGERIILARGEATGHAHAMKKPKAKLFSMFETRYLRVEEDGAALTHEEHAAIELPKGDYRVVIQREFDPKEEHFVSD
jgi:hypothetical protein